ncbi:hypothetical protein, partial [Lactobacillus delbrueckii]
NNNLRYRKGYWHESSKHLWSLIYYRPKVFFLFEYCIEMVNAYHMAKQSHYHRLPAVDTHDTR